MQKGGILTARIGESTVGLRPSLTLGPTDASHIRKFLRHYHPNHAHNETPMQDENKFCQTNRNSLSYIRFLYLLKSMKPVFVCI